MSDPVTLGEAKLFLRVSHSEEDSLITLLLSSAKTRLEGETGLVLDELSPAPLRLCILSIIAQAYQDRGASQSSLDNLEPWLAPFRLVHL